MLGPSSHHAGLVAVARLHIFLVLDTCPSCNRGWHRPGSPLSLLDQHIVWLFCCGPYYATVSFGFAARYSRSDDLGEVFSSLTQKCGIELLSFCPRHEHVVVVERYWPCVDGVSRQLAANTTGLKSARCKAGLSC